MFSIVGEVGNTQVGSRPNFGALLQTRIPAVLEIYFMLRLEICHQISSRVFRIRDSKILAPMVQP